MTCRYDARQPPRARPPEPHRLTNKQYQLLSTICDGTVDEDGDSCPLDMEQLLERLPYRTTRDSLQFSLRALESRRLIVREYETRRERKRLLVVPTKIALKALTNQFDMKPNEALAVDHYV